MHGRIFSVETNIVYACQQTLSSGDLVVGRIIKETIKVFGKVLMTKYAIQKSLPRMACEDAALKLEMDRAGKEIGAICTEKRRGYEHGK